MEFFNGLTEDVQKKFNYTLELIATIDRVPKKYFQHMEGTVGLYEIRVEVGTNIFRAFAFWTINCCGQWFSKENAKDT